jgi:uncharacterized membrane protein YfhO
LRADYLLRAIPIEQGEHRVELIYKPSSLLIGETISLFSATILIVVIIAWLTTRARSNSKGN